MAQTVIIVDDSNLARLMLRNVIRKHFPAWNLLEADTGAKAMELCKSHQPDIALLDYNMPDVNGLDLALELMQWNPDILIYLVTANIQEATRQRAEAAGVGFVHKPVDEKALAPVFSRVMP